MFNTLFYIPIILAYTFIAVLLVTFGVINIYVAYKIYKTLYGNPAVAQLSLKYSITQQFESVAKPGDMLAIDIKTDGPEVRKPRAG